MIQIISLAQHLGILVDCLYFHSKLVIMILQEIYLIDITNVKKKDLNTLIDNEKPLKNKQEA